MFKVSRIYIDALAAMKSVDEGNVLPLAFGEKIDPNKNNVAKIQLFRSIASQFAPPQGEKKTTRLVHPDMVVAAFLIVAVFILVQIFQTQPAVFPYMLAILVLFIIGYVLLRKQILGRFQGQVEAEGAEAEGLKNAIAFWMKLYYCARDNQIFDPEDNVLIGLDEMDRYLIRKAANQAQV
jgi:hypothetical protein